MCYSCLQGAGAGQVSVAGSMPPAGIQHDPQPPPMVIQSLAPLSHKARQGGTPDGHDLMQARHSAVHSGCSDQFVPCRELGEGRHQSVDLYRQLAYNMNCSHHLWVNERAEHAFFVEHDFEVEQHPFRPHPDPAEPIPGPQWPTDTVPRYWFYQVCVCVCVCVETCLLV